MLNFNTNISALTATTASTASKSYFTDYASKKRLFEASILTEAQMEAVSGLKNAYCFSVHTAKRYVLVHTFVPASKSYVFYVLDLETMLIANVTSVKLGKQAILQTVAAQALDNALANGNAQAGTHMDADAYAAALKQEEEAGLDYEANWDGVATEDELVQENVQATSKKRK